MPSYHRLGQIPRKRHTVFRQPEGALYAEELMGNKGFVGPASLLYHLRRPTSVLSVKHLREVHLQAEPHAVFGHRHFLTHNLPATPSVTIDRVMVLFNADVTVALGQPQQEDDFFFRNAQADEVLFVGEGEGVLQSMMGELPYHSGDYLVIPRGILYHLRFASAPQRFLVFESTGYVRTPSRYRNEFGQLMEDAPYCERDLRRPEQLPVHDEQGEFRVLVKKRNSLTELVVDHHPFDVVGWDGYYYPWAFSIHDFEPRVGRFHMPPPTHQTFEGDGFAICSFCPRPYDFDPEAIPAPYNHSNVMSDEVIYYANAEFMSRKGIQFGSITLHPDGLPHGPHPGRAEESIGTPRTEELAVMIDAFRPLHVTQRALAVEDKEYYRSWLEQ